MLCARGKLRLIIAVAASLCAAVAQGQSLLPARDCGLPAERYSDIEGPHEQPSHDPWIRTPAKDVAGAIEHCGPWVRDGYESMFQERVQPVDRAHVLFLAGFVPAHPARQDRRAVGVGPRLGIPAQQAVEQVLGDFDGTRKRACPGRVNLSDVAAFQRCFTGPSPGDSPAPPVDACCLARFDLNGDAAIDAEDYALFRLALRWPDRQEGR